MRQKRSLPLALPLPLPLALPLALVLLLPLPLALVLALPLALPLPLPLPLALPLALGIKSFMRKAFLGDGSLLASPSPGSINPCILSSFGRFLNHIGIIPYSVFCIIFLYHIGIIPSPDSDFSLMSRSPSSLQKRQMHKDGNKEANQDRLATLSASAMAPKQKYRKKELDLENGWSDDTV